MSSSEGKYIATFRASEIKITRCKELRTKPKKLTNKMFGKCFTDHMLAIEWDAEHGWGNPAIKPTDNFNIHPAASVFHYGISLFEGMKAYRTFDGQISLFRPLSNMERMRRTARRATLPDFDPNELLHCLIELIKLDHEWIPEAENSALYIRPTMISTTPSLNLVAPTQALLYCILSPVMPYFDTNSIKGISLLADPTHVRAFPGGVGEYKMACNYAPTVYVAEEAKKRGYQQILWLLGKDHKITEVGTMNFFIYLVNESGEKELTTMPLKGEVVLPGITRDSILHLARTWGEFKVTERTLTMKDVTDALEEGRIIEMFGTGTACDVCPVDKIGYQGKDLHIPTLDNGAKLTKRFLNTLTDIKRGKLKSDWTYIISLAEKCTHSL